MTLLLTGQRTGPTMLVAALLLLVLPATAAVHVLPFAGPPLMGLLAIGCMPGSSRPSRRAHTSRGQGATPSLQDTTVGI